MEAAPSSNPPQNGALRPAHDTRLNGLAHALSRQCDGAIGRTAGPATETSTSSPARRARATTLGATAPSPASPWRGQQAPACTPSGVAVGKDRGPCSIRRGVGWAMWTVWTVWTVSPSAQITEGHRRASAGLPAASGQLERGPARGGPLAEVDGVADVDDVGPDSDIAAPRVPRSQRRGAQRPPPGCSLRAS